MTDSLRRALAAVAAAAAVAIALLGSKCVLRAQGTALASDLTVVSRLSGTAAGGAGISSERTSTVYYSGTKRRTRSGNDFDRIEDSATGRVITIDHGQKTYYDNSIKDIKAAMEKDMRSQVRELEKAAKDMPELKAILTERGSPVTVRQLPTARKIAGYECKGAVYAIGDVVELTVWHTPTLPTRKDDYAIGIPPDPLFGDRLRRLYQEMQRSLQGFELSTEVVIEILGNRIETLIEAVEVRLNALPADTFEPPPGYTKKSGLPRQLSAAVTVTPK